MKRETMAAPDPDHGVFVVVVVVGVVPPHGGLTGNCSQSLHLHLNARKQQLLKFKVQLVL